MFSTYLTRVYTYTRRYYVQTYDGADFYASLCDVEILKMNRRRRTGTAGGSMGPLWKIGGYLKNIKTEYWNAKLLSQNEFHDRTNWFSSRTLIGLFQRDSQWTVDFHWIRCTTVFGNNRRRNAFRCDIHCRLDDDVRFVVASISPTVRVWLAVDNTVYGRRAENQRQTISECVERCFFHLVPSVTERLWRVEKPLNSF